MGGRVDQLEPFTDTAARIDAAGPPIMLHPEAAQNIGLALHELAINALKYGALSSPEGRIVIRWMWTGSGQRNFGCRGKSGEGRRSILRPMKASVKLLSRIAKDSPDTESGLVFGPEGLSWRLECSEQLLLRQ